MKENVEHICHLIIDNLFVFFGTIAIQRPLFLILLLLSFSFGAIPGAAQGNPFHSSLRPISRPLQETMIH